MKLAVLALSAVFLMVPAVSYACSPQDFTVQNFRIRVTKNGARSRLHLSGKIFNHCSTAAGAKIQITAKDKQGNVVQKSSGWPAGSSNIAPGASVSFNMGALFRYDPSIASYSAAIVSTRKW